MCLFGVIDVNIFLFYSILSLYTGLLLPTPGCGHCSIHFVHIVAFGHVIALVYIVVFCSYLLGPSCGLFTCYYFRFVSFIS